MGLYDRLLDQSDFVIFVVSILGVGLLGFVAILTMGLIRLVCPNVKGSSMVATMLTGILLPAGMVIAFVAADVWKMDERGRVAVEQEAAAVLDSIRVAKHLRPVVAQPIKMNIGAYIQSVINDEWPLMADGQTSEGTETQLEALMLASVQLELQAESMAEAIAGQELRKYVTRIELARDERLRISETAVESPKWVAVFVLLFVAACVIAELHVNHLRTLVISITLFSLGFGVTIFLISSYDRPFTGSTILKPSALAQALQRLEK